MGTWLADLVGKLKRIYCNIFPTCLTFCLEGTQLSRYFTSCPDWKETTVFTVTTQLLVAQFIDFFIVVVNILQIYLWLISTRAILSFIKGFTLEVMNWGRSQLLLTLPPCNNVNTLLHLLKSTYFNVKGNLTVKVCKIVMDISFLDHQGRTEGQSIEEQKWKQKVLIHTRCTRLISNTLETRIWSKMQLSCLLTSLFRNVNNLHQYYFQFFEIYWIKP